MDEFEKWQKTATHVVSGGVHTPTRREIWEAGRRTGMEKAAELMAARVRSRHGWDKYGDIDAILAVMEKKP